MNATLNSLGLKDNASGALHTRDPQSVAVKASDLDIRADSPFKAKHPTALRSRPRFKKDKSTAFCGRSCDSFNWNSAGLSKASARRSIESSCKLRNCNQLAAEESVEASGNPMTSNWQKLLPTIKPQKKPTQPKPADSKPGSLKAKQSKVASTASKVSKKPVVKQAPVTVPAQLTASEPNKSLTPAVKRKRAHDDFLDSLLSSKSKKSNILESSTSVENEAQLSVDLLVAEASDHEVVHEPEPLAPKKTRGHSEDPVASLELEAERKSALSILDAVLKSEASAVGSQKLDIQEKADSEAPLSEAAMTKVGKYLAIDCEMVGVGLHGAESALARVSIVNFHGHPLLDTFVIPREPVTDYRTHVSGITPALIDISKNKNLITFEHAQQTVAKLIKDKIVVGHALKNDFKALLLDHPRRLLRDTSEFKTFKEMARGRKPALKKLAKQVLNVDIQGGEHSSVEDARVSMLLYKKYRASWESTILKKDK